MIDVMSFRQSYKRREVTKIKWIYSHNNPADSMTKSKASTALKTVIDTNRINLDTIEWVERANNIKNKGTETSLASENNREKTILIQSSNDVDSTSRQCCFNLRIPPALYLVSRRRFLPPVVFTSFVAYLFRLLLLLLPSLHFCRFTFCCFSRVVFPVVLLGFHFGLRNITPIFKR